MVTVRGFICRAKSGMLLVAGACGGSAQEQRWDGRELELVEVARLESGAAGAAEFGRITDLEIGDDGTVYVLDGLNRIVHAFGEGGAPLGSFGGRGAGPGELEQPVALFSGPDGTLWLVDARNARYTVFDRAGELVRTYRGEDPDLFHPLAVGFGSDGHLYTVALGFGRLEQPAAVLIESVIGDDVVVPIRRGDLPFAALPAPFELRGEGMMLVVPVPFSPEPALQIDGKGRLWYASGADPWVQRWSVSGGPVKRYGRDFTAPPVSAAERDAALASGDLEELRDVAGPAGIAELSRRIPERKPHLRGFFVDDASNVWIMPTPATRPNGEAVSMEVYDSSGERIGVVRALLAADPRPRLRGGVLAGVTRDELGMETVVLYRVVLN